MRYVKYFFYICRHKWYVLRECWRVRLYWLGIIHDLSKFLPAEFRPYADKFYGRFELNEKQKWRWQIALLHHYNHNKHHSIHWVTDPHKKQALPIPDKYLLEMVCDWRAMKPKNRDNALNCYLRIRDKIILHPDSRMKLEQILEIKVLQKT